ncbi:MAG: GNAT family N-acetyltransferase [Pseudomonadota bacterium]
MSRPAVFTAPQAAAVRVRPARVDDLPAINAIVERAVMTWQLADRVKRLSLPSYRYHALDFVHMHLVVAEDAHGTLLGVAAWDDADARDTPAWQRGLLLHGLYVDPSQHRSRIGSRLLDTAAAAARAGGCDGLLVKAQADANGFFAARGLERLPVNDPARDYPHRYWLALAPAAAG